MFSPIQKDVLIELLNIHIGQASSLLSEMLNQRVILTIPEIEIIRSDNLNILEFVQLGFSVGQKIISSIKFESKFEGMAYLVFPIERAKSLVEICMINLPFSEFNDTIRLTDLDFDVLKELCNIVFNSLIGEFGNLLNLQIKYSVPDINILCISDTDKNYNLPPDVNILILHTKFLLTNNEIGATILITLSENSTYLLINKINDLLGDLI